LLRWFARASLVCALLALAGGAHAGSCSMDGCPMDVRGHDSGQRFSVDLSYLHVDENQRFVGSHEVGGTTLFSDHVVERLNRSTSTILTTRAQITERVSLSATLPWVDREHQHDILHHVGLYLPYAWNYSGLGDAALVGSVTPWSNRFSVQGGVKLPTGRRHVDAILGLEPEPSVRPGSGSTDWLGGIQLHHSTALHSLRGEQVDVPLTLGVAGRVNGRGTDGYRSGNELSLNLAAGYPIVPALSLLAQVSTRWQKGDDTGQPGVAAHETGGTSVLATPGLRLHLGGSLAAYGYYQFRLYQRVNSAQLVSPSHLTFGTLYSFGS
jgi:Putative MetA-pathway of phenol degradation